MDIILRCFLVTFGLWLDSISLKKLLHSGTVLSREKVDIELIKVILGFILIAIGLF